MGKFLVAANRAALSPNKFMALIVISLRLIT
jgi:hypothetical protein